MGLRHGGGGRVFEVKKTSVVTALPRGGGRRLFGGGRISGAVRYDRVEVTSVGLAHARPIMASIYYRYAHEFHYKTSGPYAEPVRVLLFHTVRHRQATVQVDLTDVQDVHAQLGYYRR